MHAYTILNVCLFCSLVERFTNIIIGLAFSIAEYIGTAQMPGMSTCITRVSPRASVASEIWRCGDLRRASAVVRAAVQSRGSRTSTVRTLIDGDYAPGRHVLPWNGRDARQRVAASGI